jgi:uncharacterized protein YhfF
LTKLIPQELQLSRNTDELAGKVLSGEKIAISSLYAYCRMNLKEISKVGDYAILDSSGDEVCVVRILFTV